MEVFQFDKSMMDRLEEAQNVLNCNKVIPASRVAEEWSYNVELLIEPAGGYQLQTSQCLLFSKTYVDHSKQSDNNTKLLSKI